MQEIKRKYKIVVNGNTPIFGKKTVTFGPTGMDFNGDNLHYLHIVDTTTRDNRVIIQISPQALLPQVIQKSLGHVDIFSLEIMGSSALEFERIIDRNASKLEVEQKRKKCAKTQTATQVISHRLLSLHIVTQPPHRFTCDTNASRCHTYSPTSSPCSYSPCSFLRKHCNPGGFRWGGWRDRGWPRRRSRS